METKAQRGEKEAKATQIIRNRAGIQQPGLFNPEAYDVSTSPFNTNEM